MRSLPILAVALALLLPAGPASAVSVAETAESCVEPAKLVACISGTVSGTFECRPHNATRVSCWANATWSYTGATGLPAVVGGDVSRAGGFRVDWCEPGGFCRSVGVGLLVVSCLYLPNAPCRDTLSHSMWLGTPKVEPGQCIDFTFTGWISVWGDVRPRQASTVASLVVHGHEGPLLKADAFPSGVERVCN